MEQVISELESTISVRNGYVLVEDPPNHVVDADVFSRKLDAICQYCVESAIRDVLVVASTVTVNMGTHDLYDMADRFAETRLRIAVFAEELIVTAGDFALFETRLWQHGIPVRFFRDRAKALSWLRIEYGD